MKDTSKAVTPKDTLSTLALFNVFTIRARYFPALITGLPILLLLFAIKDRLRLDKIASFLSNLEVPSVILLYLAFVFLYVQLIRIASKHFEKKYFDDAAGFPTAYLMSYTDETYSRDYKDRFRRLVRQSFQLELLGAEEETADYHEALRRLGEATMHIVHKVRDNRMVRQHNITYAFWRNLIGGVIYGIPLCVLNIVLGLTELKNTGLFAISLVLGVIYSLLLLFRKRILIQQSVAYAKQLITAFVASCT